MMRQFRTVAVTAALVLAVSAVPSHAETGTALAASPAASAAQFEIKPVEIKPVEMKPAEAKSGSDAQKGLAGKAIDRVTDAAQRAAITASDNIFGRIPCRKPKNDPRSVGSLPHVAGKLAAGKPVTIIAFGSSSTQGHGSSRPEFNYPSRLAVQLRKQYPGADITVVNQGIGGEDAPEMMKRIKTAVLDANPDLVIWQVGTNAIMRNLDPAETAKLVDQGIGMIKAVNADLVLIDPQYSPRVNERAEGAGKMVQLLHKVAELRKVGIFPRFEVMREWHENQDLSFDKFVIADGLHMNDWGYACFAQLLGDDIIRSVGQIKLGVNTPDPKAQQANKPL